MHSVDKDTSYVLNNIDASTANNKRVKFKKAVLAYFTTRTYKLYSLQQLAIENIKHYSIKIITFNIFNIVN